MTSYKLYLDDIRVPDYGDDWIIARSFDDGLYTVVEHGCPRVISFDHDLGTGMSGMDFAKWLVDADIRGLITIPDDFTYFCHSANPVGRANILGLFDGYFKQRR